jgi:catechol 2,3-dioxygenase-like lactoylglutathione lyase family enzyme
MFWQSAGMAKLHGIKETCLSVADLDRAERFYRDLFELPLLQGDARLRALDVAGCQVLLLFAQDQSPQPVTLPGGIVPPHQGGGQSHLAFAISADDLDEWRARLTAHGVTIESTVTWPRGGTSVYFRDPDRHLVELITPGVWPTY